MMDVCLAGTGGMLPLPYRYLTTCWVELNGSAVLIDCGEGTQIALASAGVRISRLDCLLITHFHADHISGLPGLMLTLGNQGKTTPLTIFGPQGLGKIVSSLLIVAQKLPFEIIIKEFDVKYGIELTSFDFEIKTLSLRHKIPCVAYSLTYHRKPVFNPEKAKALEIPVIYYKHLHAGENVDINGKIYTPDMVLDGVRAPIKLTYCTDTLPFDEIADFAKKSDLFICEGMYGDEEMSEKMDEKCHMIFADAANLAKKADADELWLTHFSPAMPKPKDYKGNVKKIFENSVIAYDGIRKTLKGK